ncbi:MAG: FAD:protein FMN transferase [Clostridia bacterium]|nr:FAD:protein FMN transferase [Clostridia bacterium]
MKKTIIFLLCILCLTGCTKKEAEMQGFSMDAPYRISANELTKEQEHSIKTMLKDADSCFDAYQESSTLSQLNHHKKITVSKDDGNAQMLYQIISASLPFCNQYFDITIRPISKLWDFNADKPVVPDNTVLKQNLRAVDWRNVILEDDFIYLENEAEIDLGAVAKGYICDKIADYLTQEVAIVDIGGTVKAVGEDITAGIKSPTLDGLLCSFTLPAGKAVATSGSYERNFTVDNQTYHHIINPKTGYPFDSEFVSVSVICDSAMEADILATTWFCDENQDYNKNVEAIFVTKDNKIIVTDGIKNFNLLHTDYTISNEKVE